MACLIDNTGLSVEALRNLNQVVRTWNFTTTSRKYKYNTETFVLIPRIPLFRDTEATFVTCEGRVPENPRVYRKRVKEEPLNTLEKETPRLSRNSGEREGNCARSPLDMRSTSRRGNE